MNDYRKFGGYTGEIAVEREQSDVGTAITFLLIGAAVGAVISLLFSPVNGEDVRAAIGRGYRRTVDGVTDRTKDLRERGSNLLGIDRGTETDLQYRRS
jgi:gas vesicle protein